MQKDTVPPPKKDGLPSWKDNRDIRDKYLGIKKAVH